MPGGIAVLAGGREKPVQQGVILILENFWFSHFAYPFNFLHSAKFLTVSAAESSIIVGNIS